MQELLTKTKKSIIKVKARQLRTTGAVEILTGLNERTIFHSSHPKKPIFNKSRQITIEGFCTV